MYPVVFIFEIRNMVQFNYQQKVRIESVRKLKAFVEELIRTEKFTPGALSYVFCTDAFLLAINQQYLQHDDYTDIITFDYSARAKEISGEIYISVDRVKENARLYQVSFQQELLRVVFHGVLHLCGYKDKKPADQKRMREKEQYYMDRFYRST